MYVNFCVRAKESFWLNGKILLKMQMCKGKKQFLEILMHTQQMKINGNFNFYFPSKFSEHERDFINIITLNIHNE